MTFKTKVFPEHRSSQGWFMVHSGNLSPHTDTLWSKVVVVCFLRSYQLRMVNFLSNGLHSFQRNSCNVVAWSSGNLSKKFDESGIH